MNVEKYTPEADSLSKPYWDAAQHGKLVMQRCTACREYTFFPKAWCPHCWNLTLEWAPVSGRGHVLTYSVVHYGGFSESYAADIPYVVAVIKLEEGPQMMANVIGCKADAVKIGMPVKVTFEQRKGGFKIPQFEPA